MAEIKNPGPIFKVTMTEYERGWGQRDAGEKFFDTEEDAALFCREYNKDKGTPDYFFRAEYRQVV